MSEIWRPSPARVADANLTRFTESVNSRAGLHLGSDYKALWAWSTERPADFWVAVAKFADLRVDWGSGPVLENPTQMPGASFFPNAKLNFATRRR